ncbi:LuxR family transcriptional regulator [Actinomadura sp. 7K507]|uniref:LuxR family transcriptional regulator n=1 Tax=Actinomadura sp. 7K507 TaxID=2530365 RepID=UPI001404DA73|nr:LuxR family transcriptional regulator [Actinomadura sp. 7K507]
MPTEPSVRFELPDVDPEADLDPASTTSPALDAIEGLRESGGLVVVVAGPGFGASFALRSAVQECRRTGWQVLDGAEFLSSAGSGRPPRGDRPALAVADPAAYPPGVTVSPPTISARTVVVTAITAGLTWPGPMASAASGLLEESRLRVIHLPRLGGDVLKGIVASAAPGLSAAEIDHSASAAAGNPLVALHLARHGHLRSPELDRVVLARLLDRFGEAARAVASVLAALMPVTLDNLPLIAELADVPPATAAGKFDILVEAGLVAADPADGYRISVPWLADALYAGLGPATRERLHRCAVGHLTSGGVVQHEMAAHHLLQASTRGPADVDLLLTVADDLTATAPDMAADCYRRALGHVDGPPERIAEITARLARASLLAGRPGDTVDVGRPLLDDPGTASAEMYPWLLSVVTEAMKATLAVEDAELILRGGAEGINELLDAQAAYLFATSGRDVEARVRIRRARSALARRSVRGQVNMLSNILHAECIAGDFAGLREDAGTLEGIVDQTPAEVQLHAWATLAHVRSVEGDLSASTAAATRAEELLHGVTWGVYVPGVRYARAAIAFAGGRWDDALEIAAAADEPLAQSGTVSYLHLMRNLRARILANRGELADARRLSQARGSAPHVITAMHILAVAEIEILEGNAAASARRLADTLRQDTLPGQVRAELLAMLARASAACGDIGTIADCHAEVEERFGVRTASRQVRLELRLARARAEGSAEFAKSVLREATGHGFTLFEGRALLALGRLDVDPEANLTEAMQVFGHLNAVPWRRSTATELRERGFRVPRRARTSADHLTETEIQLARLVQAARSNKEIADAMSLSVKTVEVYLSRLYAKVGCKNRLDLARAADEGRLPLPDPAPASVPCTP